MKVKMFAAIFATILLSSTSYSLGKNAGRTDSGVHVNEGLSEARVGNPKDGITLSDFKKLKEGMTMEQVESVLGRPGELTNTLSMMGVTTESFGWRGDGGSSVIVTFQQGKVTGIIQMGLK